MTHCYIGLMSGTSADGIDAALVDFSSNYPQLIDSFYKPYDSDLRQEIINLCSSGPDEILRFGQLDIKLGKAFAAAANFLIHKHADKKITAIGSHGQTIRHYPHLAFTLQIGDPNIIAALTNTITISDFRRKDLALGGQGAPLVPAFHQYVFAKQNHHRAIVNIGGIANVTLIHTDNSVLGFDTGPGNTLLDAWIHLHENKLIDAKGEWGASGEIHQSLLSTMLQDPYFQKSQPKSTGREYFNLDWLQQFLKLKDFQKISPADIQATLTELTAITIINAIPFVEGEILICGGGAHNDFLISRIQSHNQKFVILSTKEYGIDPDWVEAMAFAWLAKQTMERQPGNNIAVTGATRRAILGGIYLP